MTSQPVGPKGRTYEFGLTDRLRVSRELINLTQIEFAEATGISRQSVSNYETGATTPKRPQLVVWAMATGFSLHWLQTGQEEASGPDGDGGGGAVVRREGIEPPTRWLGVRFPVQTIGAGARTRLGAAPQPVAA